MTSEKCDKFLKSKIALYNKELIETQASEGNMFVYIELEFQGHLTDKIGEFIKTNVLTVADTVSSIFVFEESGNIRTILISLKSIIGKNDELPSILALTFAKVSNISLLENKVLTKEIAYEIILKKTFFNIENSFRIDLIFSLMHNDIVLNIYDEIVLALQPEIQIFIDFFEQEEWVSKFVPIYSNEIEFTILNLIRFFFLKNDYVLFNNFLVKKESYDAYISVNDFIIHLEEILCKIKEDYLGQLSRVDIKTKLVFLDVLVLKEWFVPENRMLPVGKAK